MINKNRRFIQTVAICITMLMQVTFVHANAKKAADKDPGFSQLIRVGLPGKEME